MHRFFVPPECQRDGFFCLEGPVAHQISRVLRLPVGASVMVLDNTGACHTCRVAEVSPRTVRLAIEDTSSCEASSLAVTLYQALPKGDKLEWIIQKATELGVTCIQPVIATRCISKWDTERAQTKIQRWQSIAQEASEQSERTDLPLIKPPVVLSEALSGQPQLSLVLAERERGRAFQTTLPPQIPVGGLGIFVGPEGGWTLEELSSMEVAGGIPVSLGRRILRTETAGLAALAIAQSFYEWP
jgi:16S rRNA (uracil1498-N3)-methyltransferase